MCVWRVRVRCGCFFFFFRCWFVSWFLRGNYTSRCGAVPTHGTARRVGREAFHFDDKETTQTRHDAQERRKKGQTREDKKKVGETWIAWAECLVVEVCCPVTNQPPIAITSILTLFILYLCLYCLIVFGMFYNVPCLNTCV